MEFIIGIIAIAGVAYLIFKMTKSTTDAPIAVVEAPVVVEAPAPIAVVEAPAPIAVVEAPAPIAVVEAPAPIAVVEAPVVKKPRKPRTPKIVEQTTPEVTVAVKKAAPKKVAAMKSATTAKSKKI